MLIPQTSLQGSKPTPEGFSKTTSNWLERLPAGSISTWEDLTTRLLAQFFPPGRTAKLQNDILMFQQHQGESLSEAWTHFKDLLQKVPHHGIDLWLQDFAKPVKAISLPQDVPSTSNRRLVELENQVQRLMEAHLAPKQHIQVNKITSSCEICSGPYDTQYCMENPEQTFIKYASSRTDEAGGLVSNFMTSQDARLSKFEADFKQQQCEMTNKIDIVLKAITDRIMGTLPSDTFKKLKLNVNSTTPVEKEEEPKDTPQKGSKVPKIINELESNRIKEEKEFEWLDIEEPLDLVDTCNISHVMDFTILESVEANINPSLSQVVDVTFKTTFKDPERSKLTSDGHDLASPGIILSKEVDKLGPEYRTRPEESNSDTKGLKDKKKQKRSKKTDKTREKDKESREKDLEFSQRSQPGSARHVKERYKGKVIKSNYKSKGQKFVKNSKFKGLSLKIEVSRTRVVRVKVV
ncbi:MAK10-like protein [Tanacetum coccineum]